MMTTDTVEKVASATVAGSSARIVGAAKGVGMIEPKMATHISLVMTDALLDRTQLDAIFRRVVDRTLNRVSVDGDTSTSDTSVCMASGAAGAVDPAAFEAALDEVMLSLTKQIARDGEGATKLIEVRVDHARNDDQAEVVARSIVNSPLVKTAVHGAGRQVLRVRRHRPGKGRHPLRVAGGVPAAGRRCRVARVEQLHARCRRAHTRLAEHGEFRNDDVGLRSQRRLRADQRRLHDLNRAPPVRSHPHRRIRR
jgi:hypothetical protein